MSRDDDQPKHLPASAASPGLLGLLLFTPLLLMLALLFLAQTNLDAAIETRSRGIVYMALLQDGLTQDAAGEIAGALGQSSLWKSSDLQPVPEVFANDPDFEKWLNDPANREILDGLPPVIVLRPRNPFGRTAVPAYMEALLEREGVDEVYADEAGFIRLRAWRRQLEEGLLVAVVLLALAAIVSCFVYGYAHARMFRGEARFLTSLLLAASGLLALLILAGIWAWLYFATTFALLFPPLPQAAIVIGAGIVLSLLASAFRRWFERRAVRRGPSIAVSLATLFFCGALLRPACSDDTETIIEERQRSIAHLREWLGMTETQRELEPVRLELRRERLQQARVAFELAQSEQTKHQATIQALRKSAGRLEALGTALAPNPDLANHAKIQLARAALRNEAADSFRLLAEHRDGLRQRQAELAQLDKEVSRLALYARHAGSNPEAVERELELLEAQVAALQSGARIEEARIESPPVPTDLTPPPSDYGYYAFVPYGTLIRAVASGTVLHAGPFKGLGEMVTIDHSGGYSTHYAYLAEGEIAVRPGEAVRTGQIIGTSGKIKRLQSADGFRFEVRLAGKLVPIESFASIDEDTIEVRLTGR